MGLLSKAKDLITYPSYIMRIVEKKKFGREADINEDEGTSPSLYDRFDTQREATAEAAIVAEFKFPINADGRTFFYQQYSRTSTARQSTVNGVFGVVSELYGKGISDVSISGEFNTAGTRTVLLASDLSLDSSLTRYDPKDWADNLKRFIDFYLDLHDPYSSIWTEEGYFIESKIPDLGKLVKSLTGSSNSNSEGVGYNKRPNPQGYELIIVDEYARTIQSIHPKDIQIYAGKESPLTFGWRINGVVIEDKLEVNYEAIPDDLMQIAGSFRLATIEELPILGPLTETMNKLISMQNAIGRVMDSLLHYKDISNRHVHDCWALNAANANVINKMIRLSQ